MRVWPGGARVDGPAWYGHAGEHRETASQAVTLMAGTLGYRQQSKGREAEQRQRCD